MRAGNINVVPDMNVYISVRMSHGKFKLSCSEESALGNKDKK